MDVVANERRPAPSRRLAVAVATAAGMALLGPSPASALPSYARQTNSPCSACHVGAFGPELTPYGRAFKLSGYGATQSWAAASHTRDLALSAMAIATYTHTGRDQSAPPADHFGTNDNSALQEASLFLGGKLAPGLGVFAQATYSGVDRNVAMDNFDVRYAHDAKLFGKSAMVGVSVNNNPTVQDAWNTTPAWGFPFVASDLAPGPAAAPLVQGGLAQQVIGVSPYLWWDRRLYAEVGVYQSLSAGVLNTLHADVGPSISGGAPYARIAYERDFGGRSVEVGAFGLEASLEPDRMPGPTDRYEDIGLDASYQAIGSGRHEFQLNAAYVHEQQRLDATYAAGGAERRRHHLDNFSLNAAYDWDRRYGLTAGLFRTSGDADRLLYAPEPDSGSRTGEPATTGYVLQADFTPWGDRGSWHAPWANLRLGLQYTGYTEFNGAGTNYDGFGREASGNNTLMAFAWPAF